MKSLHVDNKPPSMVDDYQDFNTKNILFGRFDKLPNRYIGLITVSVIKAYTIENNVNGNRIDDNDWTKFFDELYYKYPDYTYEQLCELLKSTMKTKNNNDDAYPTFEYVVAAAMFAYKSQNAELITRLHNTFGRPLKLDCKNAWLDNWSLNGPGNALNFIFWKDYDSEDRISYSEYFHDAQEHMNNINNNEFMNNTYEQQHMNNAYDDNTNINNTYEQQQMNNTYNDNTSYNNINEQQQMNNAYDDNINNNEFMNNNINNNEFMNNNNISLNNTPINDVKNVGFNNKHILTHRYIFNNFHDPIILKIIGIFRVFLIVNKLLPNASYVINEPNDVIDISVRYFPIYYIGSVACNWFDDTNTASINTIKRFVSKYPMIYVVAIINTASSENSGGAHWMGLCFINEGDEQDNNNYCYLMCSQGSSWNAFMDNGRFNKTVIDNGFVQVHNSVCCQYDNCNCGVYSFLFIYMFILNKANMEKAIQCVGVDANSLNNNEAYNGDKTIYHVKEILFGYK